MASLLRFRLNHITSASHHLSKTGLFTNTLRSSTSKQSNGGKVVIQSSSCKPAAAYSAAIKANGFLFISGQLGLDASTGQFVSDDVEAQAQQALSNIKGICHDAGSDLNKICKTTVLLADIGDFSKVNTVYSRFFEEANVSDLPARAAYAVANLPLGAKVEIEAIALE